MASAQVVRVTMFKFPKKEDQDAMLESYKELWNTAVKDGKPYILSLESGSTFGDSNPNYNFVGKSIFKSIQDMLYYDKECPAHQKLKAKAANEMDLQGVMTVYFTPGFSASR